MVPHPQPDDFTLILGVIVNIEIELTLNELMQTTIISSRQYGGGGH